MVKKQNICYLEDKDIGIYKINHNKELEIGLWNETLKLIELCIQKNNTKELKNTLLYNLIQSEQIKIKSEYIDTIFPDILKDKDVYDEACIEVIKIQNN